MARLHRQRQVVEHAEAPEDAGDLEAARQSRRHAGKLRYCSYIFILKKSLAGIRNQTAANLADQRGLAGAVGPDQGMHLAFGHLEADVVGGHHAAEALADALKAQHFSSSRAGRRCPAARTARWRAAPARPPGWRAAG